jgi:hypothetical protein
MIAPDAQRRLEIFGFWRRHGLAATCEAFQLSRRTLYLWRAKLYDLLFIDDPTDFNLELLRYLARYNLDRPHFSPPAPVSGRKTPRLPSPVQFLHQNHQCNMYWADTLFQDASLVYAVGAYDLLKGFEVAGKNFNRPVEMYLLAACVYFAICFSLSMLLRQLQKNIAIIR